VIPPAVVTAEVLLSGVVTVKSIWMLFVDDKLGFKFVAVVELVPVKLMVVVVEVAVILVLLNVIFGGAGLPVFCSARVKVTPAGTPENVNLMFVPFVTAVPLLETIKAVRQAAPKPSVMTSDPVASGTVRFVKIEAVARLVLPPLAPTEKVPMPEPKALITVMGPGVVKM
jgi:hypothetical protein